MPDDDIRRLFDEGQRLHDAVELDAAEAAFLRILEVAGDQLAACWRLGLIYKVRRDWPRCVDFNQRCLKITHEKEDPAWWNLGIAATALGDWTTARRAWRGYGLKVANGVGPLDMDLGLGPVRLNPSGDRHREVLMAVGFDPARSQLVSVPNPIGGHRWRDIILRDGAPNGYRISEGQEYPVFDEIERLVPSTIPTVVATVECRQRRDSEALSQLFWAEDREAEDWSTTSVPMCHACSVGTPHERHAPKRWTRQRSFGIAADHRVADGLLKKWVDDSPATRRVISAELADV